MKTDRFLSTSELADILGISRIAVFKKIKSGQIKAQKVGRNYVIDRKDLGMPPNEAESSAKAKVSGDVNVNFANAPKGTTAESKSGTPGLNINTLGVNP